MALPLSVFAKRFILDVCQGSEYAFDKALININYC